MKKYLLVLTIITISFNAKAQEKGDSKFLTLEQVWSVLDVQNKELNLADIIRRQSELDVEIAKDKRILIKDEVMNVVIKR